MNMAYNYVKNKKGEWIKHKITKTKTGDPISKPVKTSSFEKKHGYAK